MPGQLPLRLLRCSSVLVSPPTNGPVILRRLFPFRLSYSILQSLPHQQCARAARNCSGRTFSTRAARSRSGPVGEGQRRDTFRSGSVAGQSKSLIDDEAELSDWVNDLKMDSLLSKLGSGSDESESEGRPGRAKNGTRGNVDGRRESLASSRSGPARNIKRRRESETEDDFDFLDRGQSKDTTRSLQNSTQSKSKPLLNSDSDEWDEDEDEDLGEGRRGKPDGRNLSSGLERSRGRDPRSSTAESRDNGRSQRGSFPPPTHKRGERSRDLNRDMVQAKKKGAFQTSEEESDDFNHDMDLKDGFLNGNNSKKEVLEKHALDNHDSPEVSQSNYAQQSERSSYLSNTRFDECSLSPLSLKGVKAAGYEHMTMVQEATLPVILKGKDVLAKAKTGTGKTVAFLLPAIEIILKQPGVDRDNRRPPIYVLVICPTRELANQAAMEAEKLLKFHPSLGVQFVVGGTRLALEQKRLQANPCHILVATPGRLRDHIENTAGFGTRLMGVQVLVLDECDRLLDMGFRKDIERIISAVPKQRQTLLFSATVPDEVRQVCHIALRRDHEFISTVEEGSEETHSQVQQNVLIAPLDKHFSVLYHLLTEHIADDIDYKVLVFCTTAMVTKLVAEILSELKLNVREIHSRKAQSYRTKVSDEFRKSKGLILVTSDVSARGVDYPDVTLVIQVGVPSDREQYIHRLGRTGRRGKEGQGVLLLAPWEDYFLSTVKNLPVSKLPLPSVDPEKARTVDKALCHVEMKTKESAYQAWLGYYNSNKAVGRDKFRLVELANEFSRSMGLDNPPAIKKIVLGKMGLRNIPGLRSQ